MGRKFEAGTFEGHPNYRWVKMIDGRRHRVTCAELNLPESAWTKEGSYQAANEWCRRKLAEMTQDKEADHAAVVDACKTIVMERVQLAILQAQEILQGNAGVIPHADQVLADVQAHSTKLLEAPAPVQLDLTLGHQAQRFLATQQARGKAPATYGDLASSIAKVMSTGVLSQTMDLRTITPGTFTDLYAWLKNKSNLSQRTQQKTWKYFVRFVRWLWKQDLLPVIPRNLDDGEFTFNVHAKKIKTYPVDKVRKMLADLPERLRLYALLALNCGMQGADMSQIRHEEYKNGRVKRKRSKTKTRDSVPEVDYQLWPETRMLIDRYPSNHPEYVLASQAGTPLWRAGIVDGKWQKIDLIAKQWHRGRGEGKAHKPPISLKALRSHAATLLDTYANGRFTSYFLGHSPKSIKDKHYAAPDQQGFDEAVLWLRKQVLTPAS